MVRRLLMLCCTAFVLIVSTTGSALAKVPAKAAGTWSPGTPSDKGHFIDIIRAIGPAHCIVSTDSGLTGSHNHADAMVLAIRSLRDAGFSETDLDLMFRRNPAFLVGLPPLD